MAGKMPNNRSALDARTVFCLHTGDHWPGASESERLCSVKSAMNEKPSFTRLTMSLVPEHLKLLQDPAISATSATSKSIPRAPHYSNPVAGIAAVNSPAAPRFPIRSIQIAQILLRSAGAAHKNFTDS